MKILLLTCSSGEGHNSAAIAIYDEALREGHEAEIAFSNHLGEPKRPSAFDKFYNSLITHAPSLFGVIYNLGLAANKVLFPNIIYCVNRFNIKKLYHYIVDNKFDAVICTHPFMMSKMTAIRKKYRLFVPSFGVLTDYTYIPFINNSKMDKYFIAHADLRPQLIGWKIPIDKQCVTGMPTKQEFSQNVNKDEIRKKLNLPQDKKIILVVGGAVGCRNIYGVCKYFKKLKKDDIFIYVVTGHNDKMFRKITNKYVEYNIIPIRFTPKIYDWVKASDVVITKPGGLSSSEIGVANVPIVHLKAKWGCEAKNAKFFSTRGMSRYALNNADAVRQAFSIINHNDIAEFIITNQKQNLDKHAAKNILREVAEYV